MTEIEVKFKLDQNNIVEIKKRLVALGYLSTGREFHRTYSPFKPDYSCAKSGIFMRTRIEGSRHTMTVKVKSEQDTKYVKREEIEMEIEDAEKGAKMFQALGFSLVRIFERYRENWKHSDHNKSIISIDELPIGTYLEIEGTPTDIEFMIKEFNLHPDKRITVSYWALYEQSTGMKSGDMVFKK